MIFFSNKKRRKYREINPDEIFLDSKNSPGFDTQQFEGRIERPLSKKTAFFTKFFLLIIGIVFVSKLWALQVVKGEEYVLLSEKNSLNEEIIFADRGIVYDRNNIELVWNEENRDGESFARRVYTELRGFGHLLGFVTYPNKDRSGSFWQSEFIGKDGVELYRNDVLGGVNGVRLFETDAFGAVLSEHLVVPPVHGKNIKLTIDAKLQDILAGEIESLSNRSGFYGGSGILMNVDTGDILAIVNYPEYDSSVLSLGDDRKKIVAYNNDIRKPYLNRATSGLYTPGSIVKPFVALGALSENIISPTKTIYSPGFISVPNPYDKDNPTIFREAGGKVHGSVDIKKALAVSSNVYFMTIGGGTNEQKGLGPENIEKYTRAFGLGQKTGILFEDEGTGTVPSVSWKKKIFPNDPWRLGDTYNTSIGQYGFQITPIQAVRAIAGIAKNGILVTPKIFVEDQIKEEKIDINIADINYQIVKDGMRMAVTEGTSSLLNLEELSVAAKTGTAEVGISKNNINTWVVGFFPYENPKYSFVVLMDNAPEHSATSATSVMRPVLQEIISRKADFGL